ncbi:MAG: hypothetical protein IJS56_05595 [Bacilli bacterium]|nr:hypothetical protein [Bacilli bacterium]
MKKIGKFLVFLVISLIGINHAMAWDEFGIIIESDTNIKVKNGENVDYTGDTSGIYSYDASTNTLTLKEDVHYVIVKSNMHEELIVTSNDKKTYVNMVYGPIVTMNKLNSESFMAESSYIWDYFEENNTDTPIMTHVHVGELVVKDSKFILKDKKYTYDAVAHTYNESGYPDSGNFTIQNSTFKIEGTMYVETNKKVTIKDNSKVKVSSIACTDRDNNPATATDELIVKDSELEVSFNDIVFVFGSYNHSVVLFNKITVDNSDVITNAMWGSNIFNMNNSNMYYSDDLEKFDILSIFSTLVTIENSDLDLSGAVFAINLSLTNSNLSCESGPNARAVEVMGYDGSTISALIAQDVTLVNSNFKAISLGDVPAILFGNNFTSDKSNFVMHNGSYNLLTLEEIDLEDDGFFANPNNYSVQYNLQLVGNAINVEKSLLLNGKASNVVISGETIEMTIKVVNGTWEDGSSEDKHVTMILGQIPDKNMFKTKASKQNQELVIERTGDNEYSYVYKDIVNPKTGVSNVVFLLFSSIILFSGLFLCRKELSLFKNL